METKKLLPEITIKAIFLGCILAILLTASNTYLALKIGILTSASIPAAVLSMGILRLFKNSNILENNLVQTAASAGEAVAGGIVYTIPALIIIRYWTHFSYWENIAIALTGGILGVLFSIPLRKILVSSPHLPFPEGQAIAEVLQSSSKQQLGFREMLLGGAVGALLELAQNGFKIIANYTQYWFTAGKTLFGFGSGFSAALIGAGYLIGFNIGISLFIGAMIALLMFPLLSTLTGSVIVGDAAMQQTISLYSEKVHYIGIGAMLVAGLWTVFALLKPFAKSLAISLQAFTKKNARTYFHSLPYTERDIPSVYTLFGILTILIFLYFLLQSLFNIDALLIPKNFSLAVVLGSIFYILIIGFIFSAICGYFSGLVGVSASPGSAVIIAGMLLAALILRSLMQFYSETFTADQLLNASAITIIIGAIITGAAAIANDNIQDLKVGHIIGATPWKQQIMLLIGVLAAASVIPPVMDLLFQVYGIADVFPHANMDPSQTLAAPPAAMMASITQGVFNHQLPWAMLSIGAGIILVLLLTNHFFQNHWQKKGIALSPLSIAVGIYLPMASSIPLCIGAFISLIAKNILEKNKFKKEIKQKNKQRSTLLACGLVAGAALMDVLLAIPMAMAKTPDVLNIMPKEWQSIANILGILSVIFLAFWFFKIMRANAN
jgi:putative OPT family oligopeptide transporter